MCYLSVIRDAVNGDAMKPKNKILILSVGLILPYMALVVFFALRAQEHRLPTWFPYFGLSYILATMIVVMLYSRRLRRDAQAESAWRPTSGWRWVGRGWVAYLIVVWSALFLRGAYSTVIGRLDWRRSVPAGAFLLAFIVLFSWALYRDFKPKGQSTRREPEENTSEN